MKSKQITIQIFQVYISVFSTLERLGLMDEASLMVTWQKKPRMIINRNGELEFENPQELYGAIVNIWTKDFKESTKRFTISSDME